MENLLGRSFRARRRLMRPAPVVAVAVLILGYPACFGGPPARAAESGVPSASEALSLQALAANYPCAAVAVLQVMSVGDEPGYGALYLEEMPSQQSVLDMLSEFHGQGSGRPPYLWRNPYSDQVLYVEIHWAVTRIDPNESILTTSARLVNNVGVPLEPPHSVEPRVSILRKNGSLQILGEPLVL